MWETEWETENKVKKVKKDRDSSQQPHTGCIEVVYPRATLPVSVTGDRCSLNCAHCGGRYLRSMLSLEQALKRSARERSYLLSGGCDRRGVVPHLEHLEKLKELSRSSVLNLHPGLVGESEAKQLGKLAHAVSFDFVADDATVKEVYGEHLSAGDFWESYRALRRHARVIPHLCIGLRGGKIQGEYKALEMLQEEGVEAVTFLVFCPTPGTKYAACTPPSPAEVARLLAEARLLFPQKPLYLGCMRPGGGYRRELDPLAVQAGINRIVHPAPGVYQEAREQGLKVKEREECCVL